MAFSLLRRRSPERWRSSKHPKPSPSPPKGYILSPPTFVSVAFILFFVWFISSKLLVSEPVRICIATRKIHLYCIPGGTTVSAERATSSNYVIDQKEEEAIAIRDVEQQIQLLRSSASQGRFATDQRSCDGRGIYVYDLPPKFNKELLSYCDSMLPWSDLCDYFTNEAMGRPISGMGKGWYKTHQYSLEPIFHLRILNHPCRTYDSGRAKLFYVPFYGGLDVLRWHFKNNVSTEVKDALGVELVTWLSNQPPWARNSGRDHMFVLGKISWDFRRADRQWGSNFLLLEEMQNPYKFLIEREPWKINEIGIPHPTHFHPHSDEDISAWQSKIIAADRRSLVGFAGAARPGSTENIRSVLIRDCVASSEHCRFLDCHSGQCAEPDVVIGLFMESEFCLQPPGDSPTRKSVFDSLVSGCIPVLFDPFTAYYQYPWHLPEDHRKYSVFVDKDEVREGKVDVMEVLKKITVNEREEMRRFIVYELMPGLVYGDSSSKFDKFRDAFGIVVDNLLNKVVGSE